MEYAPLNKRIAIIGIDVHRNDDLEYVVKKFQNATDNILWKDDVMSDIFDHTTWCACFLSDKLWLSDNTICGTSIDGGRFTPNQFLGNYDKEFWNYRENYRCSFVNIPYHIVVVNGNGELVVYSDAENLELWKGPVLLDRIKEWYSNNSFDNGLLDLDDIIL